MTGGAKARARAAAVNSADSWSRSRAAGSSGQGARVPGLNSWCVISLIIGHQKTGAHGLLSYRPFVPDEVRVDHDEGTRSKPKVKPIRLALLPGPGPQRAPCVGVSNPGPGPGSQFPVFATHFRETRVSCSPRALTRTGVCLPRPPRLRLSQRPSAKRVRTK